jgi:acetyl esterase/lipase
LPARWISRPINLTVKSADGTAVPLVVFPRTCGDRRTPGPAMLWIHGGPEEDVAPRWYQEIQYVTALGVTVVAVNYRGSTGHGTAFRNRGGDRAGQVADLEAALAHVQGRPDVDPDRIFVFQISWASHVVAPLVLAGPERLRGLIDWVGAPEPLASRLDEPAIAALPPTLMITATADPLRESRGLLAKALARAGRAVTHVELEADHAFLDRAARAAALREVEAFVFARAGSCR